MLARILTPLVQLVGCVLAGTATEQDPPSGYAKDDVLVGIDLGTTFSYVSIYYLKNKSYDCLNYGSLSKVTLPSAIYFTGKISKESGMPEYLVGYDANVANENDPDPGRYLYGFKRIVGIDRIEKSPRLKKFREEVSYHVKDKTADNGKGYLAIPVVVEGKEFEYTPTMLSTMILGNIKSRLNALNLEVKGTCITTPVYFTSVQDDEVKTAAADAGFASPVISKEPIAACVSYVEDHMFELDKERKVLVFDFGGGTLDISVLDVEKEKAEDAAGKYESSIVANRVVGDNFLGGENVNTLMCNEFETMAKQAGHRLTAQDRLRLRLLAEKMKIDLCTQQKAMKGGNAKVTETFWFKDETSIVFSLTHDRFNELLKPIYARIEYLMFSQEEGVFKDDVAQGNQNVRSQIGRIILVGGSTRIPKISELLKSSCPKAEIYDAIDADRAVGEGACKISVNTHRSGTGESRLTIVGTVPMSVGLRLSDGSMESLIAQDTLIPAVTRKMFTTVYDNQQQILVELAMGARVMFDDNEKIGNLTLTLKNPKPKGAPKIEVEISYYEDYSFKVTAKDLDTNLEESAFFNSELGKPSRTKVEEMLAAAKKFESEDKEKALRLENFRLLEAAFGQLEAGLKAAEESKSGVLSDLDKSYFKTIVEGSRKWIDENRSDFTVTVSVIQSKLEELQGAAQELAAKLKGAEPTAEVPAGQAKENGRDVL